MDDDFRTYIPGESSADFDARQKKLWLDSDAKYIARERRKFGMCGLVMFPLLGFYIGAMADILWGGLHEGGIGGLLFFVVFGLLSFVPHFFLMGILYLTKQTWYFAIINAGLGLWAIYHGWVFTIAYQSSK